MLTEEKIKEIKKLLRKGEPEGEIKESLKRQGYSEDEIGKIFQPHHYDMRSWYLLFAVIVFLLGVYIFLNTRGLLVLILSFLLFAAYYYETIRLARIRNQKK